MIDKDIHQKGFTLIELLIVIAIIGVLSSFMLSNFIGARQRARDAQRKSDLRQIQSALELWRSDFGAYPDSATYLTACGSGNSLASGGTTYIQTIPCDPLGTGSTYNGGVYDYVSSSPFSTYSLVACLENPNDTSPGTQSSKPSGTGNCSGGIYLKVTNP